MSFSSIIALMEIVEKTKVDLFITFFMQYFLAIKDYFIYIYKIRRMKCNDQFD